MDVSLPLFFNILIYQEISHNSKYYVIDRPFLKVLKVSQKIGDVLTIFFNESTDNDNSDEQKEVKLVLEMVTPINSHQIILIVF